MKILGAAIGAAALANLPSKWDKPEVLSGVFPAHACQSVVAPAPEPVCQPIVRTAVVGIITGTGNYVGPFNLDAPITQAELDLCPRTQISFAWSGDPSPAIGWGVRLHAAQGVVNMGPLPSPVTSNNPACWTGAPFTQLGIGMNAVAAPNTWDVGTVTVTIS